jgi:hypothetical protein
MLAWDECKRKFKAGVLMTAHDKPTIYTAIGTAAHFVIEQVNKGIELDAGDRNKLMKEKIAEICAKDDIGMSFTKGFLESRDVVVTYAIPDGWNVIASETKMVLEFPKFDFAFIVDCILQHQTTGDIRIIDYKTSAAVPKSALQLFLYAWGVVMLRPELARQNITSAFHMLRTDKLVYHEIEPAKLLEIDTYMQNQVALMEKMFALDYFPADNSTGGCHFCPVWDCDIRE